RMLHAGARWPACPRVPRPAARARALPRDHRARPRRGGAAAGPHRADRDPRRARPLRLHRAALPARARGADVMSAQLRAGIIGAGAAAREIHGPAYAASAGATLTAIASRRPEAARALADRLGGGVAASLSIDALLEGDTVDLVSICTPPHTHRELAE